MAPNETEQGKTEESKDTYTACSQDRDSSAGRESAASFDAFYDFAFPRVYRFAQRHTETEPEAEALCRLILIRALASLGGLGALEDRVHRVSADSPSSPSPVSAADSIGGPSKTKDANAAAPGEFPGDLAFWLFCIARKTAEQIERNPDLLKSDRIGAELAKAVNPISWSRVRVPSR